MSGKVIVDASVALKWLLDDEADLVIARNLLTRWETREVELVVPSHWPLEVLNGIWNASRKKRVDLARAQRLAGKFAMLGVATTDVAPLLPAIYQVAVALERTTYDAAYPRCSGASSRSPIPSGSSKHAGRPATLNGRRRCEMRQIAEILVDKLKVLPEEKQREVLDFAEFLEHQVAGGCPARKEAARDDPELERRRRAAEWILAQEPIDIRPFTVRDLIEDGRDR